MLSASLKPYLIERKYSCKLWPWCASYVRKLARDGHYFHIDFYGVRGENLSRCFKTIFSAMKEDEIIFNNCFCDSIECDSVILLTSCQLSLHHCDKISFY